MNNFSELAKEYTNTDLTKEQITKFEILAQELLEWNKKTNLTGIKEEGEIYLKHFLDSLSSLKAIPKDIKNIADVGSGAGFPGLPLAIVLPNTNITMIESVGKKTLFIEHIIKKLELKNAKVENSRAEDLVRNPKHKYEIVIARAVAILPKLATYCSPLLKKGGKIVAMKSLNQEETDLAKNDLGQMALYIDEIIPINISGLNPRCLVVIKSRS